MLLVPNLPLVGSHLSLRADGSVEQESSRNAGLRTLDSISETATTQYFCLKISGQLSLVGEMNRGVTELDGSDRERERAEVEKAG